MDQANLALCAPLQQLNNEHVPLRMELELINELTEDIEYESGDTVLKQFPALHKRISAFTIALSAHSRREEESLFPMLAPHLGPDSTTIETMEFEHRKAEAHLKRFLDEADQAGSALEEDDARAITVYAVQAYTTLIQHFANEEKTLLPLAERLLSSEEKEELARRLERSGGSC